MPIVYLALGSNVGDSEASIRHAITLLKHKVQDIKQAPLYISKAVGYTDQPDFYNTAISCQTALSPDDLLTYSKEVEKQVGRVRRFRWGPREIDIDIIFYGQEIIDTPYLTIPHARFAERDFVLRPLVDIDPKLRDPRSGMTAGDLLAVLPATDQAILRKIG